jgi:ankyrin repeat protein
MGSILAKRERAKRDKIAVDQTFSEFVIKRSLSFLGDGTSVGVKGDPESNEREVSPSPMKTLTRMFTDITLHRGRMLPRSNTAVILNEYSDDFFMHCRNGDVRSISKVISEIRSKKDSFEIDSLRNEFGFTGLHVACAEGHDSLVQFFINFEADINYPNKEGWTPLHSAVFHGHLSTVKLLLERPGIKADVKTGYGCSIFHLIASSPRLYMIEMVSEVDRQRRAVFSLQMSRDGWTQSGGLRRIELVLMDLVCHFVDSKSLIDESDRNSRTPLMYAAELGHADISARLLSLGADPNTQDRKGQSPLHFAVMGKNSKIVENLVTAGANINCSDEMGRRPLHLAMKFGDLTLLSVIVSFEPDVNVEDANKKTALIMAMEDGRKELFQFMMNVRPSLDCCDDDGRGPMIYAVNANILPILLKGLNYISDVEKLRLASQQDRRGNTALHYACIAKNIEYVKLLLNLDKQKDTLLYITNHEGDYPIHLTCKAGDLETLGLISDYYDSLDVTNASGETPLMHACHLGNVGCVLSLLNLRKHLIAADMTVTDNRKQTAFHHACISGAKELVQLLLSENNLDSTFMNLKEVKINDLDDHGNTALMLAVQHGHFDVVYYLIETAQASIANKDNDGWTVLHYASDLGNATVLALLLRYKHLNIEEADNKGWTPLMHAVAGGNLDCAQMLIDHGADLDARNKANLTCFDILFKQKKLDEPMKHLLCDGMRLRLGDLGIPSTSKEPPIRGKFIISLIKTENLILPSTTCLTFASMKFMSSKPEHLFERFTSASVNTGVDLEWYEPVQLSCFELGKNSFIVIEVFSEEIDASVPIAQDFMNKRRLDVETMRAQVELQTKIPYSGPSYQNPARRYPLGFVVIPFRLLRESATDHHQIRRFKRLLRGGDRGSVTYDIEFRPYHGRIYDISRIEDEDKRNLRDPTFEDVLSYEPENVKPLENRPKPKIRDLPPLPEKGTKKSVLDKLELETARFAVEESVRMQQQRWARK